jgi:predicted transcriptional regulator
MKDGIKFLDEEHETRAAALRERIKKAGLTIAEFRRRAGLSRNVAYAISKGREPTADEQRRIDSALR